MLSTREAAIGRGAGGHKNAAGTGTHGGFALGEGSVPSLHHRDGLKGTKHSFGQRFPFSVTWKGLRIIVIITITMLTERTCSGELKSDLHRLPVENLAQVWPRGDLKEFQACSFPITGGLLWAEEWVALGLAPRGHSHTWPGCLGRQSTFRRQSTFGSQAPLEVRALQRLRRSLGRARPWGHCARPFMSWGHCARTLCALGTLCQDPSCPASSSALLPEPGTASMPTQMP